MGFNNPAMGWKEFEKRLSDRGADGRQHLEQLDADGGVSPAWTRTRLPYEPVEVPRASEGGVPYAELHCHSNFSFLDGASHPEELVEEAVRLGLNALAITDHDGFYGVVRFAEAARAHGIPTIFGAELTIGHSPKAQPGEADPHGSHVVVLAKNPKGYSQLARAITQSQLAGEKSAPHLEPQEFYEFGRNDWAVLTGCRKGIVPKAFAEGGIGAAEAALDGLVSSFGRANVYMELWDHGLPQDSFRNDKLSELAAKAGVESIATNNVHYASPARWKLATAMSAVRARRSLDEMDGWLPPAPTAFLRSGTEQAQRFCRYPGVVDRAAELGLDCAFDLQLVAPKLPDFPVPPGHTEMSWLRLLVEHGGRRRYGTRDDPKAQVAWKQIDHELSVIEHLGFPGYFLVVWDLVEFCRRENIYCQGRGSAANSAACYVLGITKADAISLGLLFERFLSTERDGPPDIDIDIESSRREEVIQYAYERYGRTNAAQVANVITYRARSAIRDVGRALGFSPGQLDAWGKQADGWGRVASTAARSDNEIPMDVLELAEQLQDFPRHLGIHSGGMVICDRPVSEVCPVEWGRMPGRSVLQWDKDDCAATGLVKFDLLGLGMLTMLHTAVDLVRAHYGVDVDIATIPQEQGVYDMLCQADSVGVFQVESRAQMGTLPRLKPRCFYDLVVEVALIRPGPIQGGSVHPYLRRRDGTEPVTYLHPLLEKSLKKTLGVPLFQEQLMQMAIDVAGFSAGEADQLRQAMGSKRSHKRMASLQQRFIDGARLNGVQDPVIAAIWDKLAAFANFGFPESHSVSFAYLVYASAWFKLRYPAAFAASLLNSQPMGFWSPATILADAGRHGVKLLSADVNLSDAVSKLEAFEGQQAIRVGVDYVRFVGDELAKKIHQERIKNGPYRSIESFARRTGADLSALEALATSGAFDSLKADRREALWSVGAAAQVAGERHLDGLAVGVEAPQLPKMNSLERVASDLWATGFSTEAHPVEFTREDLTKRGVLKASELATVEDGSRVYVAGVVTHRQRPATASGTTFVSIEDESGLINVICSKGLWARYRKVAQESSALVVRGRLERKETVVNIVADKLELLPLGAKGRPSRDFH